MRSIKARIEKLENLIPGDKEHEDLRQFLIEVMGAPEDIVIPPDVSLRKWMDEADVLRPGHQYG